MTKKPTGPGPQRVVVAVRQKRTDGDTVALTVRVTKDWVRLRQLAMSEGSGMQALARPGLSRIFAECGLPPVES